MTRTYYDISVSEFIKFLAEQGLKVSRYQLYNWEGWGLIENVKRSERGSRLYSEKHLATVGIIYCFFRCGFTKGQIKKFLQLKSNIESWEYITKKWDESLWEPKKKTTAQFKTFFDIGKQTFDEVFSGLKDFEDFATYFEIALKDANQLRMKFNKYVGRYNKAFKASMRGI